MTLRGWIHPNGFSRKDDLNMSVNSIDKTRFAAKYLAANPDMSRFASVISPTLGHSAGGRCSSLTTRPPFPCTGRTGRPEGQGTRTGHGLRRPHRPLHTLHNARASRSPSRSCAPCTGTQRESEQCGACATCSNASACRSRARHWTRHKCSTGNQSQCTHRGTVSRSPRG